MSLVAILGDEIAGMTDGEHSRTPTEYPHPHSPLPISGNITGNVSTWVTINGKGVATVDSTTTETDGCCLGDNNGGKIVTGWNNLTIDGKAIAHVGSKVESHDGESKVSKSNQNYIYVG